MIRIILCCLNLCFLVISQVVRTYVHPYVKLLVNALISFESFHFLIQLIIVIIVVLSLSHSIFFLYFFHVHGLVCFCDVMLLVFCTFLFACVSVVCANFTSMVLCLVCGVMLLVFLFTCVCMWCLAYN